MVTGDATWENVLITMPDNIFTMMEDLLVRKKLLRSTLKLKDLVRNNSKMQKNEFLSQISCDQSTARKKGGSCTSIIPQYPVN